MQLQPELFATESWPLCGCTNRGLKTLILRWVVMPVSRRTTTVSSLSFARPLPSAPLLPSRTADRLLWIADIERSRLTPALRRYHKVPEDSKHVNDWSLVGVQGLPAGGVLDLSALGLPELSMRVRVGRNLKAFPLPGAMSKTERCSMENFMLKAFEQLIDMPEYGGKYCSFTPGHPNFVNEQEYQKLVDAHIAFKDMSADTYLLSAGTCCPTLLCESRTLSLVSKWVY